MKVFISQPMNNKTNDFIEAERSAAINRIKEKYSNEDVEAIDSFFKDAPHDAKPMWFLGKGIMLMNDADLVYFCKDWEIYRGCRIEHDIAIAYGKKIMHEE